VHLPPVFTSILIYFIIFFKLLQVSLSDYAFTDTKKEGLLPF